MSALPDIGSIGMRIEVEREFEPRLIGEKEGIASLALCRFGQEQRAIKRDARVEIAGRQVEMHFHARTFTGRTDASAASRRTRASDARE